jgi:SPX domain protein involved in polyphosphate accumulation
MKFTHFILKHLVPEWEKLYLNFRVLKIYLKTSGKLKKLLLLLKKTRSEGDYRAAKAEMLASAVYEKMKSDNEGFIDTFRQEIIKVERFIEWKWCDLKMKLCRLRG